MLILVNNELYAELLNCCVNANNIIGKYLDFRRQIIMKTQNGFTLLNKNEIGTYLAKQKVTRKITRLQVQ